MKSLQEFYEKFKKLKFPKSSSNEILGEIFSELVLYDSHVAGAVDKLLKKKHLTTSDLQFDSNLERKLTRFISKSGNKEDIKLAEEYLNYLGRIKEIIKVAQSQCAS